MRYIIIPVTPLQQNCTLMCDEATKEAAVSDPGGDLERIEAEINKNEVKLTKILVTHGHQDHCGQALDLSEKYNVPIIGPHIADEPLIKYLDSSPPYAPWLPQSRTFKPERYLNQGDIVNVGQAQLKVFHCPGHTPGHVVYYDEETGILISGDVLFQGSIGRTDRPGGSFEALKESIQKNLYTLPDNVYFIAGHGNVSTIGVEKKTNPFVKAE